jgi:hypothetical protein
MSQTNNGTKQQLTRPSHRTLWIQAWGVDESLNDKQQKDIQQKRCQEMITLERNNINLDEARQ